MHVLLFNSDYKTKKTVRFTHTNVINTFAHAHLLGWWGVRGQRSGYCTVTDALIWWAQLSQLELATFLVLSLIFFACLCMCVAICYVSLKWVLLKPS